MGISWFLGYKLLFKNLKEREFRDVGKGRVGS